MKRFFILLIVFSCFINSFSKDFLFFEDFTNLDGWSVVKLPLAKNPSSYTIVNSDSSSYLKAHSRNGASSLQSKTVFNVYEYPFLKWRWKTDTLLKNGDVTKKDGDDYPIRVYVNFVYNRETAGAGLTFRYNFVKRVYGLELPHYSLNYIIESRKQENEIYNNPFDPDNSKIIIKRAGGSAKGVWFEEEADIIEDFKRAFGFDPPKDAYIAIMSDTDNTQEEATAYIDYIGVYK